MTIATYDAGSAAGTMPEQDRILKKAAWRLLPLLFLLYVVAHIDRVNVGFAKLQMAQDLQFSDTAYGIGAGIFFLGYFLFEVPSNMLLERVGARRWIARILIFWGPISAGTAFVDSATSFYILRFLLGVGEAGLFPGIILYLTYWFPAATRARYLALFMLAIPVAGVVSGPLSGLIMTHMDSTAGLSGWQWMFILEGLPAVFLGIFVLFYLDDNPQQASWLSTDERNTLLAILKKDWNQAAAIIAMSPWASLKAAMTNKTTWAATAPYFLLVVGATGVAFWLPQIINDLRKSSIQAIGFLSAIPFIVAIFSMILVSVHSDRTGKRRSYLAAMLALAGVGFAATAMFIDTPLLALAGLTFATAGFLSAFPLFWAMITPLLAPATAAVGIAFINCFGNLGGAVGPILVGYVKQHFGLATSLYVLAGSLVMSCAIVILFLRPRTS